MTTGGTIQAAMVQLPCGSMIGLRWRHVVGRNFGVADGDRPARLREALIGPLREVYGVSDKVLAMTLSCILLGAPRGFEAWREVGASMIAIDTLVHNFLHRTGILKRLKAEHAYGAACYRPGSCADIIARRRERQKACSQVSPLLPQQPTCDCNAISVAKGQCTKSLRSSPLRGGGSREAANPIDRTAITVWRGQHDQQAYCKMIR